MSRRKLLPALAKLSSGGWLGEDYRVFVTSRSELNLEKLCESVRIDRQELDRFASRLITVRCDPAHSVDELAVRLRDSPRERRLYYAATPPEIYAPLTAALAAADLVTDSSPVVLEKPIGADLDSYLATNRAVSEYFPEKLIYRIDHYLGKETVQNLLCLRFANLILEPLWNRSYIDHVQISVAEEIGVEGRAGYYDSAGALRDMVQNHLAQLLCLTAMEPPRNYDADSVRDEKLKVLRSMRSLTPGDVVVGQYRSGLSGGQKVPGYSEEIGGSSDTETYAALRVMVDNWRWSGVPFYLRTGKRLPVRDSRITVRFKAVPHAIFGNSGHNIRHNRIVIRLQPDEGIELVMHNKIPGPGGLRLKASRLNLNYTESFGFTELPDAYERLLLDALRGNPTLFMRDDEVEASWRWIEPVLGDVRPALQPYQAGTWGPDGAQLLIAQDRRQWDNPELRQD